MRNVFSVWKKNLFKIKYHLSGGFQSDLRIGRLSKMKDNSIISRRSSSSRILRIVFIAAILVFFFFQVYALIVHRRGDSRLPEKFGNFSSNRAALESAPAKDEFAFAVAGDTNSIGTFERLSKMLRKMPLDFLVLVGDASFGPTPDEHRLLRAEWAKELRMPFPTFYAVGNRDVGPEFPIERFEKSYGPGNFSFEYQNCLFIVLRMLDEPFSNADSLEFLRKFRAEPLDKYRRRFVFVHIPPPVTPVYRTRAVPEGDELVALFDELKIDTVFSGHYHAYGRVRRGATNYIITGGGGDKLSQVPPGQFHHALVVRVSPDSVEEQLISVPETNEIEDRLEKYAITEWWPLMRDHPIGAVTADGLGLIVLIACLVWRRR